MRTTLLLLIIGLAATPLLAQNNVRISNDAAHPVLATQTAGSAAVIVPADGADLPTAAIRGIYVGVTGDVKVDLVTGGTGIVFKAAPVGILAIQAKRVYATGTTATNLVALY